MNTTQPVKKFFGFCGKLNFLIVFAIRWVRGAYKPERRVFGSHRVIGNFRWFKPSSRTMVLGSTQALPAMNTRGISCGVKPAGVYGWQPWHFCVPTLSKFWETRLLRSLRAYLGLCTDFFHLSFSQYFATGPYSDPDKASPNFTIFLLEKFWTYSPLYVLGMLNRHF
jgi:hypothetical protein